VRMENFEEAKRKDAWTQKAIALSSIISALASVFAVLIIVFQKEGTLPAWFIYIPAGLLLVSLWVLVRKRARAAVKRVMQDRVAKKSFSDFIALANEAYSLLERQRTNSITSALLNLQSEKDWIGANLISDDFEQLCIGFLFHLQQWLETCDRSAKDLTLGLNLLTSIVAASERAYFEQSFHRIRARGVSLMSDNNKATLNLARENFAAFLRKFLSYRQQVRAKLGEIVVDYYVDIPKQL